MDAQDFRSLQEAYLEVVENQQLDELTPATPRNIERLVDKREKDAKRAEDRRGNNSTPEYKKYFRTLQRQKVRSMFDRPASRSVEPASTNEETDLYDIILSHLLDEGYAETPEAAEAIMVNMSEEWRDGILQQLDELSDWTVRAARNKLKRNTQRASGPGRQEHSNREFQFNKKINARNQRTGSNVSPTDVEFRNR